MKTQKFTLLAALAAPLFACGGSSSSSANDTMAVEATSDTIGDIENGMPRIPSAPAAAPASLFAVVSLGQPNGQLSQIGGYIDQIQPGMGAMINSTMIGQLVGGAVGVGPLQGVDWQKPLFLLSFDNTVVPRGTLLVVAVADQAALDGSISGADVQVISHNGFAAIGSTKAVSEGAPYALSKLINTEVVAEPHFTVWVEKVIAQQGPQIEQMMAASGMDENGKQHLMAFIRDLKTLEGTLRVSQKIASMEMGVDVKEGGNLAKFAAAQKPSEFNAGPIGSANASVFGVGYLDFSVLGHFVAPLMKEQLPGEAMALMQAMMSSKGNIALRTHGNDPGDPKEIQFRYQPSDAASIATAVNEMAAAMAKKKEIREGNLIAKVRADAIRSKDGNLHEVSYKVDPKLPAAKKKELSKQFAGVKGYFGVSNGAVIVNYGKTNAGATKKLLKSDGAAKGDAEMDAAVTAAKAKGETFFVGVDTMLFNEGTKDSSAVPVVIGVGFAPNRMNMRVTIPAEQAKNIASKMGM